MKKICKDWYYREKINKKISEFDMMLDSLLFDSNKIQYEITNLETNMNTKKSLLSMRDNLLASIKEMKILENTWNPKTGIPSFFIKNFITKIHSFSNMFLKKLNGDALKISKFEIGTTARDFSIEIIKEDGTIIPDASQCSEGEISLLTLAISLALLSIVRLIGGYNILRIDELDSHLDNLRRKQFVEIIQEQLEDLNSRQCLIISHNNEFDDIPADLILFPGTSNISLNNKNIIMDLRHIDIDKFE
jgi:DNA repair exonuclease SbcCD ATPase subunit